MDATEIKRLAALARVAVTDAEAEGYAHDATEILGYVQQIQQAGVEPVGIAGDAFITNVLREDAVTNAAGSKTESLLKAAPRTRAGQIEVKKILGGPSQ
jgi:aspartyl-tRNA(Asn)/glutamyl-tRNA(Gln) amidotransferase subunit C